MTNFLFLKLFGIQGTWVKQEYICKSPIAPSLAHGRSQSIDQSINESMYVESEPGTLLSEAKEPCLLLIGH